MIMKQTVKGLYEVVLESGEYEHHITDNLYFKAKDKKSVWKKLCNYLSKNLGTKECDIYNISGSFKGIINAKTGEKYTISAQDKEIDWDTAYGEAKDVMINPLKISK